MQPLTIKKRLGSGWVDLHLLITVHARGECQDRWVLTVVFLMFFLSHSRCAEWKIGCQLVDDGMAYLSSRCWLTNLGFQLA